MPSSIVSLQNTCMCSLSSVPFLVSIYQIPVLSFEAMILLPRTKYYNYWLQLLF